MAGPSNAARHGHGIAYLGASSFLVSPAVFVSAVLVCLVATIYPSRQAGRFDPAEALRNQ